MGNLRKIMIQRRGIETVEALLVFPLIIVVIFGGMEFGWLMLRSSQLHSAAQVGAREAALSGSTFISVGEKVAANLEAVGIEEYDIELTPMDPAAVEPGTSIKVVISTDYSNVGLTGLGSILPLPDLIKGQSAMLKEES